MRWSLLLSSSISSQKGRGISLDRFLNPPSSCFWSLWGVKPGIVMTSLRCWSCWHWARGIGRDWTNLVALFWIVTSAKLAWCFGRGFNCFLKGISTLYKIARLRTSKNSIRAHRSSPKDLQISSHLCIGSTAISLPHLSCSKNAWKPSEKLSSSWSPK